MDHAPDRHPDLLRCRGCGHRFYRGAETVDSTALYGHGYHENEEYLDYAGQRETLARNFRDYLDRMQRHGASGESLLEVGCAHGFFLAEAAARFPRVHGLDVSGSAVTAARDRLGVSAEAVDVCHHRPGTPYDVVCLWDTIEHLPDPRRSLACAARLLAPQGYLFLTTGDAGSLVARLRGPRWRMIHPPTHVHYFTRAGIRRLLRDLGFQTLGIESLAGRRQIGNVLHNLDRFGRNGALRGTARRLLHGLPPSLLRRDVRIGLGDIMFVAARRAAGSEAA
ncbi:MAG TPA: class I SAM-dependent methyltransferase [Candidatus Polarisedimenticolaceae bacterium]|nr:class I SAM-dependent methyltransferase [Candidatus Polarisedimenticolaceae bacterium]